jgi:homoserine O-succinyltransferase
MNTMCLYENYTREVLCMPIKIPDNLPAVEVLNNENIFVMKESRAYHQDMRTLKVAVLNLSTDKIATNTRLLKYIGNSSLQVDITLIELKLQNIENGDREYLDKFYKGFDEVKNERFDGLIIIGSSEDQVNFEEIEYWNELKEIMDWSMQNVYSTFHIGEGAQAGLYYHYGIKKHPLKKPLFGVYEHKVSKTNITLLRGFDDLFDAPHSRETGIEREEVEKAYNLEILAESQEAGIYILGAKGGRQIFVTGHPEYDSDSLKAKYESNIINGSGITIPENYFPKDDISQNPKVTWRGHASLLFSNWLNYYVYQETPYDLIELMYYI